MHIFLCREWLGFVECTVERASRRPLWPVLPLLVAALAVLVPLHPGFAQSVFSDPAPLNTNAGSDSGDDEPPQVTTDGAGHWVAVWHSDDTLGGTVGTDDDILVARSTDNGATWTAPVPLNTNAGTDSGHDRSPKVTTDGAGRWVAVWDSGENLGGTIGTDCDILVARSTDNGATWTAPAALNTNAGSDSGSDYCPHVATDGAGKWVAAWYSSDTLGATIGTDNDILVARSTDNGATWTAPAALNSNAGSDSGHDYTPQVTTDGLGHWVAVWWSDDDLGGTIGSDRDVLVARSTDNGANWTTPAALNTNAATDSGSDYYPEVTTDGAGHWVAVWDSSDSLGGTIGTDYDVIVARSTDNGANWTAPVALNTNAGTDSGSDFDGQMTTDGAGRWAAVWYSSDDLGATIGTDYDILETRSTDNGATWTAPAALNTNAGTDSGADECPQIATDGAGHWLVVWDSNDNLGSTIGTDYDVLVAYGIVGPIAETWVDFADDEKPWLGTEEDPVDTLTEAVSLVAEDGTVKIKGDSSVTSTDWTGRISKAMRIEAINGLVRIGVPSGPAKAAPSTVAWTSTSSAGGKNGRAESRNSLQSGLALAGNEQYAADDTTKLELESDVEETRTVYEPVMPFTTVEDGLRSAHADSALAIRLRSEAEIDPESIWGGPVPDYAEDEVTAEWQPVAEGDLHDVWVIFRPTETWYLDEVISLTVGAETVSGEPLEPVTFQFRTESEDEYQTRVSDVVEPIWQPQYDEDFVTDGLDLTAESNDTTVVTPADVETAAEPLTEGLDVPYLIGPERVYETPQRVWLPLPEDVGSDEVRLYYYHPTGDDRGWYPAENVAGWLVPDSYLDLEVGGTTYLGILVRHAGIVQLGIPPLHQRD